MRNIFPSRFVKFILVGFINTLFGFAAYSLFALTDFPTWFVLIASNLLGISFNFIMTGGLVFRDIGLSRLPRFLISYAIIFLIYLALIQWLSPIFGGRILAMAIVVFPMAILTYFIQSRFVFGFSR